MYKNISKIKLFILVFLSFLITLLTIISLIFVKVPQFVYMNIIGTFLISFTFGPIGGIIFNIIISFGKLKFDLVDSVINYPFMINIFESIFIGVISYVKLSTIKKFIVSIISLPLLIKPLGIMTYNLIFSKMDFNQIMGIIKNYYGNNLIPSFSIYIFSAVITYFIYILLLNKNLKEEV